MREKIIINKTKSKKKSDFIKHLMRSENRTFGREINKLSKLRKFGALI